MPRTRRCGRARDPVSVGELLMTLTPTNREAVRLLRVHSDPRQHAAIAAAVTMPLAARAGRPVVATAVVAALVIDIDHAVAARSIQPRCTTALARRPRTPSLVTSPTAGLVVAAAVRSSGRALPHICRGSRTRRARAGASAPAPASVMRIRASTSGLRRRRVGQGQRPPVAAYRPLIPSLIGWPGPQAHEQTQERCAEDPLRRGLGARRRRRRGPGAAGAATPAVASVD